MSTLNRQEFEQACKALISRVVRKDVSPIDEHLKDWYWRDHPSIAGLGYMERTAWLSRVKTSSTALADLGYGYVLDNRLEPEEDDAVLSYESDVTKLISRQYVVYSPTFQVPAFYFNVHDQHGAPLSITEILTTSLFRPGALPSSEVTSFALSLPASPFPLLSQGDHPTLATPSWYFHPCETSNAVSEIISEIEKPEWSQDDRLVEWMKAWFMVLENVVDLRP